MLSMYSMSESFAGRESSKFFPKRQEQPKSPASVAGRDCLHHEVMSGEKIVPSSGKRDLGCNMVMLRKDIIVTTNGRN